jgi:acetyl esterase/lipase
VAIVDFYGPMYFDDKFFHSPLPAMAKFPDFEEAFLNKIYEEPIQTFTPSSLERGAVRVGPPKPDLSKPRNAWLFTVLKQGTQMSKICADGDFQRVDPAQKLSATFSPTFFLHGTADDWVLPKFSEAAHQKLKELGVETKLVLLPDLVHGFDAALSVDDPKFRFIDEAFDFAKAQAEKAA